MIQLWAQNAFPCPVYMGKQTTDMVAGLRCLYSKIIDDCGQ
ncbi:hypothetical protein AI2818V1_0512 [Klebsiella pneumoniae]|nr:hypothetical protein AI2818V1_0512 [Klebsiella pneumoniae]CAH4893955.1 hypothetical protein AI2818V1_0512 [Klebsiella pneumoniae]